MLNQGSILAQFDPFESVGAFVLFSLAYVLIVLLPITGGLYLIYYVLTLPLRRSERARLFLDILELGIQRGETPETALSAAAQTWDRSLGKAFYRLNAELVSGKRLSAALAAVPHVLPQRVAAALKVGERLGDISKVLPTCRRCLADGTSKVRGALNYVVVIVFAATPPLLLIPAILQVKVIPKFVELFASETFGGSMLPALTRFVIDNYRGFACIQAGLILFLWGTLLAYIAGPRLAIFLAHTAPGLAERFALAFPWRRKRLQRDFSSMLALLLDAGVPEMDALLMAAEGTGNAALLRRAGRATELLRTGTPLPETVKLLDTDGELHWRLLNAVHAGTGFTRALEGWHQALDAKAFQLEQTAAQLITTAVVLLNGVIVAFIVIAMFLPLIQLMNGVSLW